VSESAKKLPQPNGRDSTLTCPAAGRRRLHPAMHIYNTAGYTQHHACQSGADLLGEVCDLGIFGLHFGLLSCELGSEVILIA